jgi:hypothetical protein
VALGRRQHRLEAAAGVVFALGAGRRPRPGLAHAGGQGVAAAFELGDAEQARGRSRRGWGRERVIGQERRKLGVEPGDLRA